MIELVFVIVVLGILASIAIPRLAVTRDDAVLVKGKSQVSAIRSGIAMQKARALLQGDNNTSIHSNFRLRRLDNITSGFGAANSRLFNFNDGNSSNVLENPIFSKTTGTGGWVKTADNNYTFKIDNDTSVQFTYVPTTGIFGPDTSEDSDTREVCLLLTQ